MTFDRPCHTIPWFALMGLLLAGLGGCAYRALVVTDDSQRFTPVPADSVVLSAAREPEAGDAVVGPVAVNLSSTQADRALEALKVLAGNAGANRVLGVRLELANTRVGASGLAVRRTAPDAAAPATPVSGAPPATPSAAPPAAPPSEGGGPSLAPSAKAPGAPLAI